MRHILIFDTPENASELTALAGDEYSAETAGSADELLETAARKTPDAVIINSGIAGEAALLIKALRKAARRYIPVAFTASGAGVSAQERLCEAGADDIFNLPMCGSLLKMRLDRLTGNTCPHSYSYEKYCDFDKLIEDVSEKSEAKGSFSVEQTDFANIYKFIARGLERSGKSVQALMLTLSCDEESEEQGISMLSEAAKICLRKGDISSVCSKNQVVVLLIGADDDGGHLVANRIVSNFYSECDDDSFSLNYDIREVKMPPYTKKP